MLVSSTVVYFISTRSVNAQYVEKQLMANTGVILQQAAHTNCHLTAQQEQSGKAYPSAKNNGDFSGKRDWAISRKMTWQKEQQDLVEEQEQEIR